MSERLSPIMVELEGKEKYQRLLGGQPQTRGMKSGAVVLKPGESVGEHSTGDREEAIMVLEGTAELVLAGEIWTARKDTLVYVPPSTPHDVRNPGDTDLKYVYVVAPAGRPERV